MSDKIQPPQEVNHITELGGGASPAVALAVGLGPPRPTASEDYYTRKIANRCTRRGCRLDAAPAAQLCARHLTRKRKSDRLSARRRRAELRDAGLCAAGCGAKCETWYCAACAIRLGRVPRSAVGSAVGQQRGGVWRDDVNGWHRFRGRGRRGAPPAGANDESDLRMILDAIRKGTEGLAYARSPEVQALGRITKQAAFDETAGHFAHAARGLDDLVDRLRKGR